MPTHEEAFGAAPSTAGCGLRWAVYSAPDVGPDVGDRDQHPSSHRGRGAVHPRYFKETAEPCQGESEENDADHQENQELRPANIENRRLDPAGDRAYLAPLCDRWRWPPEQPGVSAHLAGRPYCAPRIPRVPDESQRRPVVAR